jgi:hypothetical protein
VPPCDQAHANVAQAEQNLSYTVIRSPIDGIVLARSVDIGQTLAASVSAPELFRVASDFTHLQLQVDLDESDVAGPTAGEPATFQVEAYPEESFTGTVTQVRLQPVAEQTISSTTVGAGGNAPGATTSVASVVGYTTIIAVDNPSERLAARDDRDGHAWRSAPRAGDPYPERRAIVPPRRRPRGAGSGTSEARKLARRLPETTSSRGLCGDWMAHASLRSPCTPA